MALDRLGSLVGVVVALSAVPLASIAAESSGTRGFVLTWFAPAHYEDGNECPDGMEQGPVAETKAFLAALSPAERKRLADPASGRELAERVLKRGRGGTNVCIDPFSAPDPGFRSVKGKIGFGMDLDGGGAVQTCAHEEFESPGGGGGIDNQWYRLRGCMPNRRNTGTLPSFSNAMMRDGDYTILIELRGVDDERDDPDIEVGIYAGGDRVMTSADGQILPDASLNVTAKPEWRTETRGRIENGIVITQPIELLQLQADVSIPPYWFEFRAARLRLELQADGTAIGMLAGYQPLYMLTQERLGRQSGSLEQLGGPTTCPGYYRALQRLADGFPDPQTGRCTAISSAFDLKAVPAFIVHRPANPAMAGVVHRGARE